jgi:S1-C subfamily serine protease
MTTDDPETTRKARSIRRRGRLAVLSTVAAATVVAGSAFGTAAALGAFSPTPKTSAAGVQNALNSDQVQSGLRHLHYFSGGYGGPAYGGPSYGGSRGDGSGDVGAADEPTSAATATQQIGVVDVTSQLGYDNAESEGTGMVLTADGEILTNNHVIEDSTSISVTVVSTGANYTASVVGTDATDDIAVLQLSGASGLRTAAFDATAPVSLGETVTGVGNAGGAGGTPSAATGKVTALDQTITTQAEESAASETLNGLIESDADIQAGDSGGPLYDASNRVIGIDTAAQAGGSTTAGYSIPIATALSIAQQIEAGHASATVRIGYPAFLGVEVAPTSAQGATVSGVLDGTAAAAAGLAAGDTITAVNGQPIASSSELTAALADCTPGQRVTITWSDATGTPATATVTLGTGPAA